MKKCVDELPVTKTKTRKGQEESYTLLNRSSTSLSRISPGRFPTYTVLLDRLLILPVINSKIHKTPKVKPQYHSEEPRLAEKRILTCWSISDVVVGEIVKLRNLGIRAFAFGIWTCCFFQDTKLKQIVT